MAGETSGAYFTANAVVDKAAADKFIPEIWSDEIIASYQKNLKMAPLVKKLTMKGKKGDLIHIPKPVRGSAFAKEGATAVTIQANLESELTVNINRHFEYSRLIEDIVEVQALSSLRRFYTEDAGYQLALRVDTDLFNAATGFGNGTLTLSPAVDGSNNPTGASWVNSATFYNDYTNGLSAYVADQIIDVDPYSDAAFRGLIKKLDDNNVPMDNRVFVIPPALRSAIMGTDRYVSSDFRDTRTVQSGLIGSLYGIDIYVSSNCPVIENATANSAATNSVDIRGALLFHKEALVLAEQMAVRSQTQYKQEYLSTLFTADTLYGVQVYRPEAGFVLAVNDL
jgi:N4-gp56 family major capsid protein